METSKGWQRLKCEWLIQLPRWASEGLWENNGECLHILELPHPRGQGAGTHIPRLPQDSSVDSYVRGFISSLALLTFQAWAVLVLQIDVETGG